MKCPHCGKDIELSAKKEEKPEPHPAIPNKKTNNTGKLIDDAVFGKTGVAA